MTRSGPRESGTAANFFSQEIGAGLLVRYFANSLGAQLRAGGSLYFLTVFGVALGVASVLSIQIVNYNALAAFEGTVRAVSGQADLSVLGRTPAFSEHLYADVLAVEGVAAAWPLYRVDVALADRDRFFLEVLGVDFFTPMRIPWRGGPGDIPAALAGDGWSAVTPALAARFGWAVGDTFEVHSGVRRARLRVGALVDFQELSPLASRKLVVMDIAQAQALLGRRGELHQIDVRTTLGASAEGVRRRLQTRLGPGVRVATPGQRSRQAVGLLSAFRLNLTAMSLISLFVGLFLVYSSTQAGLERRRAEFGLLRSLGATRAQVLGLILGEVALLGALGVLLGLPLGYWAAEANLEVVSATLTNLYLLEEISSLALPRWLYGLGVAIGMGGALAGALAPALDMSRRDTRALLSVLPLQERTGSLALRLLSAGMGILAAVGIWYLVWGREWKHAGFVLCVALLIGLPLFAPFTIRQVCGSVRVRGFGLGYSLKSLGVRIRTTSFAVASLAIAVSMLVGITLMIGSFRRTLEVWIDASIRADVYISPVSWRGRGAEGVLEDELIEALTVHPGVAAVDRLRGFPAWSGDRQIGLAGVDMALPGGETRFPLLDGNADEAYRRVREEGAVFVGETLARAVNRWTGDEVPVSGPEGEIRFPVAAVYYDYHTGGGAVVMDLKTMETFFGPGPVNGAALFLKPGWDGETVIDSLKARFSEAPLQIRSNRRLRDEVIRIFDQTFLVTRILQGMSLLIAVCGISLMLLVMVREQVSELALYRAIGAKRTQVFRVFMGQGIGFGLMGLGLGLLGGVLLAGILVFEINRAYFGWTIQVYWPWKPILQQAAAILGAAVLASLYPAARASRTPATELGRDDLLA